MGGWAARERGARYHTQHLLTHAPNRNKQPPKNNWKFRQARTVVPNHGPVISVVINYLNNDDENENNFVVNCGSGESLENPSRLRKLVVSLVKH